MLCRLLDIICSLFSFFDFPIKLALSLKYIQIKIASWSKNSSASSPFYFKFSDGLPLTLGTLIHKLLDLSIQRLSIPTIWVIYHSWICYILLHFPLPTLGATLFLFLVTVLMTLNNMLKAQSLDISL